MDCYPNQYNPCQSLCPKSVSSSFFDEKYERSDIWQEQIAWANLPINKEIIIDTVNKYQSRKIKGYIVIGISFHTQNSNHNIWISSGQQLWSKIMEKSHYSLHIPAYLDAQDTERNRWHSVICYFNFQS